MKLREKAAVAVAVGAMAAIGVSLVTASAANADPVAPPTPSLVTGNINDCSDINEEYVDLFTSGGGANDYDGVEGTGTLVSLDGDPDEEILNITVEDGYTVVAIAVKGGNDYYVYLLGDPPGSGLAGPFEMNGLIAPPNGGDNTPGVSHWLVCGEKDEPECDEAEAEANGLYGVAAVARDGETEPDECVTPTPTISESSSASASASGSLPVTGTTLTAGTLTGIIGAGIALVAAGAALVFLRRRRAVAGE